MIGTGMNCDASWLSTYVQISLFFISNMKSYTVTIRAAFHDMKKIQNRAQTALTHYT